MNASATSLAAALLLAGSTSACRGPHVQPLSDNEMRTRATGVLAEAPPVVLPACAQALRDMGYDVALEDGDAGLIRTRLLRARTGAARDRYSRAYEIRVSRRGAGSTTVVATALLFAGPPGAPPVRDAAGGTRATVWSVAEERSEAARFFAAVRDALGEPPGPQSR